MLRKLSTTLLLFGGMLVIPIIAAAQMHETIHLDANVTSSGKVDLEWAKLLNVAVYDYVVFRGSTMDSLSFTPIATTNESKYEDAPPAGEFVYYFVMARSSTSFILKSNLAMARLFPGGDHDRVMIVSKSVDTGEIGVAYNYQVVAKSSDSTATFAYALDEHPSGMTVSSTGLIQWTPAVGGWYEVEVKVTSNKGGAAKQEFAIRVGSGNGTVTGTITDTLGLPIAHVMVKLYGGNKDRHFDYRGMTDSLGKYSMTKVDPGSYFARANPLRPEFLPQWYSNASTREDATPVTVSNNATTTVDFVLTSREQSLPKFVVQGSVTDSSHVAIKNAVVVFARAGFTTNLMGPGSRDWSQGEDIRELFRNWEDRFDGDFRLDGASQFVVRANVDSAGKYSVKLAKGSYIALTIARGFEVQFFDGQSDFLSANIIALASDSAGINFTLTETPPVALGEINGTVLDSTDNGGVPARIIAFRDRWTHRDTIRSSRTYFADTDSTGNYSLTNLPPGSYIVLAIPLGQYSPSFYSTAGATMRWKEATPVAVNGNTVAGIDIFVRPLISSSAGYTSVYGTISVGGGSSANVVSENGGVAGAIVYALDAKGNVAGYGVSATTGDYTIAELAPGAYTVTVDKVGFTSASSSGAPTYDVSGNPQSSNIQFVINSVTTVSTGISAQPSGYTLEQNYPNPFNPTTQIAFTIPKAGPVTMTVFNILGQHVATLVNGTLNAGAYHATWGGTNDAGTTVASGIYLYRISTAEYSAVKKMMFLK